MHRSFKECVLTLDETRAGHALDDMPLIGGRYSITLQNKAARNRREAKIANALSEEVSEEAVAAEPYVNSDGINSDEEQKTDC